VIFELSCGFNVDHVNRRNDRQDLHVGLCVDLSLLLRSGGHTHSGNGFRTKEISGIASKCLAC
jgi:hypothetical protein